MNLLPPTDVHNCCSGLFPVCDTVCRHQIAIEIWPQRGTVYFNDEAFTGTVDRYKQFEAVLYNAPTRALKWEVLALDGGPGRGSIDGQGLYTAPSKGFLVSGHTELIAVSSVDDPVCRAYALVTIIGNGPQCPPAPEILISPHGGTLYYFTDSVSDSFHNSYIDYAKKSRVFRAQVWNAEPDDVVWLVDNAVPPYNHTGPHFWYRGVTNGSNDTVVIKAYLSGNPAVADTVMMRLLNYRWPPLNF
jgi:hypothetical protein